MTTETRQRVVCEKCGVEDNRKTFATLTKANVEAEINEWVYICDPCIIGGLDELYGVLISPLNFPDIPKEDEAAP